MSYYYENWRPDKRLPLEDIVSADICLDKDTDDLPSGWIEELQIAIEALLEELTELLQAMDERPKKMPKLKDPIG